MNTNEQTMAWIMDTYSMHARHTVNAVVTGKPVELGGSRGRREATGRGVLFVINEAIKKFKLTPPQTRVVVQGSGNVGGIGARLLHEAGYKVVAISDIYGGIYNPNGIDIPAALKHLQQTRSLRGVPRRRARLELRSCWKSSATCWCRARPRTRSRSENADRIKCQDPGRGCERPDDRRRPTKSCTTRGFSSSRTFWRTPAA